MAMKLAVARTSSRLAAQPGLAQCCRVPQLSALGPTVLAGHALQPRPCQKPLTCSIGAAQHQSQPSTVLHASGIGQPCNSLRHIAMSANSASQQQTQVSGAADSGSTSSWDIKMLYDGECPLCMREVNMLKRRDAEQHRICFVDIADSSYEPADNAGISFEEGMAEIHAVLPDGKVIKNIDVFAKLYEVVGLGWVYAFTRYEPLRRAADAVYGVWAKLRLPIMNRDMDEILKKRQMESGKSCRLE